MKDFTQRVAAITGAASGIGKSLATQLAQAGCHLALADQNTGALADVRDELKRYDVKCSIHTVDVAVRSEVERYASEVVNTHGRVHLIFNNAGVGMAARVETQSYTDFEWLMQINFWGVVYGTRAFLPHLREAGSGHVVNLSSLFGLAGIPTQSAYNASKFAVRGFTEALKMELAGTGIGVSCVHPGGVRTNIAHSARVQEQHLSDSKAQFVSRFERLAMTSPEKAAATILKGVKKNKRRIIVGTDAWIVDKVVRLFPGSYERILRLENNFLR